MKGFKFWSLLVASAFSLATVKAQAVDEIVNKHIEAIGGAANWKKVTSLVKTGTMNTQGISIDVVSTVLHQKGSRQDLTIMGMSNYVIITPAAGWMFMPVQQQTEPQAMPVEKVKEAQGQLDVQGVFIDYKAKGNAFELAGSEEVNGSDCFKLKMTSTSGTVTLFFIDKKTYNLVQTSRTVEGIDFVSTFSDYQKLPEGIVVAMSSVVPLGPGMMADYTVSKVEVNKPVDEAIFKPSN